MDKGPRKNGFRVFSNSEMNVREKVDQRMGSSSFHIPLLTLPKKKHFLAILC